MRAIVYILMKLKSVVINPLVYLPWLLKQFLNLGGVCQKKKIHDISEVVEGVDIVVNCTGIRAKELVDDPSLVSTRGQNVLVKASHIRKSITMETKDDYTYIIPRTNGTVILGTTKEDDMNQYVHIFFIHHDKYFNIFNCHIL